MDVVVATVGVRANRPRTTGASSRRNAQVRQGVERSRNRTSRAVPVTEARSGGTPQLEPRPITDAHSRRKLIGRFDPDRLYACRATRSSPDTADCG